MSRLFRASARKAAIPRATSAGFWPPSVRVSSPIGVSGATAVRRRSQGRSRAHPRASGSAPAEPASRRERARIADYNGPSAVFAGVLRSRSEPSHRFLIVSPYVRRMTTSSEGRALVRRRHYARLALLKKRTTIASVLGFAALFGLVTQHAVRGASGATTAHRSSRSATRATSYFDATPSGFAFDEGSGSAPSSATTTPMTTAPQAPPVAQSSVS